jgi:sulfite exporter TauE/SafE
MSISSHGGFASTLIFAALWGLAGGFSHCIGMCGIFVISVNGATGASTRNQALRHGAFQLGRMFALCLLGAIAGAVGSLTAFATRAEFAQGVLSAFCGAVLILLAIGYAGIAPKLRLPEPDIMGAGGGAGRKLFLNVLRRRDWLQPPLVGVMVGFLPCGLTYSILFWAAASQSAVRGALTLLIFGLGTIPGLFALSMFGHRFSELLGSVRTRLSMTWIGAAVMMIMGAMLIWRSWPNLQAH